jgi:hypothetical protein
MERQVEVKIVKLEDQGREYDLDFWYRAGAAARFIAAWDMVNEVRRWKGDQNGLEPRLQRSVCRIEFRGG